MRRSDLGPRGADGSNGVGAGIAPGKRTRTERLTRKTRDRDGSADAAARTVAAAAEQPGQPLPPDLAQRFSTSLDRDLSAVRVHTGPTSAEAAAAISALAYTVGNDIHFGAGHYQPDTPAGQHLIAHEVAHTAQQAQAVAPPQAKLGVSTDDDPAEHEADRAADAMMAGAPARVTTAGAEISRQSRPPLGVPAEGAARPVTALTLAPISDLDRLPPASAAAMLRWAIGDAAFARIASANPPQGRVLLGEQLALIERRVHDSHDAEAQRLWQQAATVAPRTGRTVLPLCAAAGVRANDALLVARLAPDPGAPRGARGDEDTLARLLASDELPAIAMVERALAALIQRPEFAQVPPWRAPMAAPPAAVHLLCAGEGRRFDLRLTIAAAHHFRRALHERLAAHEHASTTAEDDFSRAFNTSFATILPGLRTAGAGPDAAAPTAGHRYSTAELARLLTGAQRQALTHYMATLEIPDRLFSADHQSGFNHRQRILIAGAILSHGRYRPGSHLQTVHARMCGHFVRLVQTYAGVGVEGIGVDQRFDLTGGLVVGGTPQADAAAGAATRLPRPDDPARDLRRRHDARFPFEKFVAFEPGDWLYVFTNTNTVDGNHSVVFAGWVTPPNPATRTGRARIFHQPSPDTGGTEATMVLGDVDQPGVHRVTRHLPLRGQLPDHAPQTVDELVRSFDPHHRNPATALANVRFIRDRERALGGHVDLAALTRELRRRNRDYLSQLAAVTTGANPVLPSSQVQLWEAANGRDDLTDLIQLCTHLQAYAYTAVAAGTAEHRRLDRDDAERTADDRHRVEPELEVAREQLAQAERRLAALASVEQALDPIATGLGGTDRRGGSAQRPQPRVRGRRRQARPALPALVHDALVAARPRLLGAQAGLELPESLRPAVAAYVHQVAEARQQRSLGQLGQGLSLEIAKRVSRERAATRRQRIAELDQSRRYHIAQIMPDAIFHGVQDTGRAEGPRRDGDRAATRVPQPSGALAAVVPDLPWDQLIIRGSRSAEPPAHGQPTAPPRPLH
ncbi:MAG: DUF4157 domain-containing protein [Kofleriaceae bacterium]